MNAGTIAALGFLTAALMGSFLAGYTYGKDTVQSAWNAEVAITTAAALKAEQENRTKEQAHKQETLALEAKLTEAQKEHEKALADLNAAYAARLQQADNRATSYRKWAEADSTERERLANHAARLDRSLEEGRELVEELWATVRQRERELRVLGDQIKIDRGLIEDKK